MWRFAVKPTIALGRGTESVKHEGGADSGIGRFQLKQSANVTPNQGTGIKPATQKRPTKKLQIEVT